ncbi:MAG: MFS transporter [Paracoccaceae bacterium]
MSPRYLTVAGACLTQFTIIGVLFSFGLFFKELQAEFGWSRTLLSGASALAFFMMGVLAMVGGQLNDRFGPRRVLAVTGLSYGLGYILLSQISAPWQMYLLFGTLIAMGMGTHDVVTLSTVARWFEGRRGLMTAVAKIGTAIGQMVIPLLTASLILAFGWQSAMLVLGAGGAVLLLIAAMLMSLPAATASGGPATATGLQEGVDFAEARKSRLFWTMCIMQFLFFPSLMTLPLHLPVHGMDLGMTTQKAAAMMTVIGGASIAGRLAVGGLVDQIGGRNGYLMCFTTLIIGLVAFLTIENTSLLFVFIAIYGFGHGGFFTVVSPSVAEYFGMKSHGAIFGTVLFFGTIGGSVGPILAGLAFDLTGSYTPAFGTLLVFAVIGLGLVLTLPRKG